MPSSPIQSARKATLPIWLMVALSIAVCAGVLFFFRDALTKVAGTMERIGNLRDASTEFSAEAAEDMERDQHRLRSAVHDADIEDGVRESSSPTDDSLVGDAVRIAMQDPEIEAILSAYRKRVADLDIAIESAMVQGGALRQLNALVAARLAAYRKAAFEVREELQRLKGKERLVRAKAAAGSNNQDAAPIGAASPEAALVELLDLITHVEEIAGTSNPDAVRDFEANWMTPALGRIEEVIEGLVARWPDAARLPASFSKIRVALLGSSDAIEESSDPRGLVHALAARIGADRGMEDAVEKANGEFAKARAEYTRVLRTIDERTRSLRAEALDALAKTLFRSSVISALAAALIVATAAVLSRSVFRRSSELQRILADLQASRKQLVDIGALHAANEVIAKRSHELRFQRESVDHACIVSETDEKGRITFANDNFCRISGYSREEVLGKDHRLLNSGTHPRAFWKGLFAELSQRGVWQGTICNRTKSGSLYWVHTTIVAFRNESGKVSRYVSIRTDITEQIRAQRKADEAEQFSRATVDALTAHVAILDENGTIIAVNRSWRMFAEENGAGETEIGVGTNYLDACDLVSGKEAGQARAAAAGIRQVLRGETPRFYMPYACHSPEERRWFMMRVTRFDGDGPPRVAVAHENVTEARLASERMQQQAKELVAARMQAEGASRAKSDFLATMSHEIRTPLNGVIGALDLIGGSPLSEQQARYLGIGKSSALSLLSIINDILDFSKIEAGKMELSPTRCDIRTTVEDAMSMLAPKASERKLELVCFVEPGVPNWIEADGDRLKQIVINLVNNAIKFTHEGSVTLRVSGEVPGDRPGVARVRLSVIDTGIGIPKDRLDRLFKAFSQTDASTTRKFGGTGLGLAICKQLTELMGGTVGVESVLGQGSTFWCEAPFPVLMDDAAPLSKPTVDLRAARVLVVDDHPVVRESLARTLGTRGITTDVAADGEAGLRALVEAAEQGRSYSLVLLDLDLPRLSGTDVAAVMQSMPALAQIPRILITSALDVDSAAVRRAGFECHLAKPVRHSDFFDAITAALARAGDYNSASAESSPAAPDATALTPPPAGERAKLRLLLAEDNEINQLIACELLSKSGFECTVASNGRAAVRAVSEAPFDIVLMDCQMPELDGFDATREIRSLEAAGKLGAQNGRRLPIIALTANALKGDRERCLEAGMDAYTTKPIDLKHVSATIESLLSFAPPAKMAA